MPEYHIQGDCIPLINGNCTFKTQDGVKHVIEGTWDLLIAHPPCTYLCVSGNAWFNVEKYGEKAIQRQKDRQLGAEFFMKFVNADCKRIAIENPIGVMSTLYRKPNQIIQPYMFGDHARKSTCLWLKGLPNLKPTNIVDPGEIKLGGYSVNAGAYTVRDENGKCLPFNDPKVAQIRSRTYVGVAKAMAEQWAGENNENNQM